MIVRAILTRPELADNFDHFNNYDNTLHFLQGCLVTPSELYTKKQVKACIARLKASHEIWVKEMQAQYKKSVR